MFNYAETCSHKNTCKLVQKTLYPKHLKHTQDSAQQYADRSGARIGSPCGGFNRKIGENYGNTYVYYSSDA
jgi:hypothetical protein